MSTKPELITPGKCSNLLEKTLCSVECKMKCYIENIKDLLLLCWKLDELTLPFKQILQKKRGKVILTSHFSKV